MLPSIVAVLLERIGTVKKSRIQQGRTVCYQKDETNKKCHSCDRLSSFEEQTGT